MEKVERFAANSGSLLACCICEGLPQRSVLLACLHNCCQQCFSEAVSKSSNGNVECSTCGEITHPGCEQPNHFLDVQVKRHTAMAESTACGACRASGFYDKPADVWCPQCRHSLCDDCLPAHGALYRNHGTQALNELTNSEPICPESYTSVDCREHNRPVEIACLNCEKMKCLRCWEECHNSKHQMRIMYGDSADECVEKFTAVITSLENDLLQKSLVLQKTKSIASGLKAARTDCLNRIEQRKRRIVEAVEEAYQEIQHSAKDAYDNLEKEAEEAAAAAERVELSLTGARSYAQRLLQSSSAFDIFDQQKAVRERLTALSAEMDRLSIWLSSSPAVNVDSSLPENVEHVVAAWVGVLELPSAGHSSSSSSASLSCPSPRDAGLAADAEAITENETAMSPSPAPVHAPEAVPAIDTFGSVQLPVGSCLDVSPTLDGRLLMAFGRDGLIELNSSGEELSRWQPPLGPALPHCGGGWPGRDEVRAVAALSSGNVAVALYWSRLVHVLQRRGKSAVDDTWASFMQFRELPWRPERLSVHGDLLAASGYLRWGTLLLTEESEQVKVASMSIYRGNEFWWRSSELSLEYRACGLAVTPVALITASSGQVPLSIGGSAHVLDAHSIDLNKRLWRRNDLCSGDEEMKDICADSAAGVLYAAVCRTDASGGRLATVSLNDGSELLRFALRFDPRPEQPLLLPVRLSLGDGEQSGTRFCVLALLCCNPAAEQSQTVTVHRSRQQQQPQSKAS